MSLKYLSIMFTLSHRYSTPSPLAITLAAGGAVAYAPTAWIILQAGLPAASIHVYRSYP